MAVKLFFFAFASFESHLKQVTKPIGTLSNSFTKTALMKLQDIKRVLLLFVRFFIIL